MPRRKIKKSPTTKKQNKFAVDGCTYSSKALADYHKLLKTYQNAKLIKSFKIPQVGEENKSKFRAIKVEIDNIIFDSINESRFYLLCLYYQKNKKIKSFELQKEFELIPAYTNHSGKKIRKMSYVADFVITNTDNSKRVIDVKGIETEVFKIKKKIFEYRYPDLSLETVRYVSKDQTWRTLDEIKAAKKKIKK